MTTAAPPATDPWLDLSRRLRSMARVLTLRDDLADDLAQQTIAHLLARAPDKLHHLGFAHATMTRLWLDDQRAHRRRLGRIARLADRLASSRQREADSTPPIAGDAAAQARTAMRSLPPARRAILALRVVAGLSYEQIATSLGCSVSTVRSELHEARKAVRLSLEATP